MQVSPPTLGGIPLGPSLTGALYVLLFVSAALAFLAWRSPDAMSGFWGKLSPWIFLSFVFAFALYRFVLVRAGRYPASKAFFQVGVGVLFFTFLLRPGRMTNDMPPKDLTVLLTDSNPRVRALAAEVARYRPRNQRWAPALAKALEDTNSEVRRQAHDSLVQIAGKDFGPPEDPSAVRTWREQYP